MLIFDKIGISDVNNFSLSEILKKLSVGSNNRVTLFFKERYNLIQITLNIDDYLLQRGSNWNVEFYDEDDSLWKNCYSFSVQSSFVTILFPFAKRISCIRIFSDSDFPVKIKKKRTVVSIFKYRGYIVAARMDGIGQRFLSMLHAMFIAKKYNLKFGYVWNLSGLDKNSAKVFEKTKLTGLYTGSENYLFDSTFISNFSLTNVLKGNRGEFLSKHDLENGIFKNDWGAYILSSPDFSNIPIEKKEVIEYKQLWESIKFSENIKNLSNLAADKAKEIGNFVAIHIRSGDIIYNEEIRKSEHLPRAFTRFVPVEISLDYISKKIKEDVKIILFGDDISQNFLIKNVFKTKKILLVKDLCISNDIKDLDLSLFEVFLMSHATNIFGGISGFSSLASVISGRFSTYFYDLYQEKDIFDIIINSSYTLEDNHILQKVVSYLYAFEIGLKLKKDFNLLENIINFCCKSDEDNAIFVFAKMYILAKKYDYTTLEDFILAQLEKYKNVSNLLKNYIEINKRNRYIIRLMNVYKLVDFEKNRMLSCLLLAIIKKDSLLYYSFNLRINKEIYCVTNKNINDVISIINKQGDYSSLF